MRNILNKKDQKKIDYPDLYNTVQKCEVSMVTFKVINTFIQQVHIKLIKVTVKTIKRVLFLNAFYLLKDL